MTAPELTLASLPRSGPAVRDALAQWPADQARFDAEFTQAIQELGNTFDLSPAEAVVERWRRVAIARSHPLTAEERELVRKAQAGDYTGLYTQADDGAFHRIQ